MKRDKHHCPGLDGNVGWGRNMISAGGCRKIKTPGVYCGKHQYYCDRHSIAVMKFKVCPSCKGEVESAK